MIQKATKKDIRTLAELAVLLWKNSSIDELINDFSEILSKEDNKNGNTNRDFRIWESGAWC